MSKFNFVLAAFLVAGVANAQVSGPVQTPAAQAPVNNIQPSGGGSAGVDVPSAGTGGVGAGGGIGLGTLTVPAVVGGSIAVGVIAAAASNAQGDSIPPVPPVVLKCDGTDPLVNGLCVGTRQETKVTVTGSGTGTSTATRTTTISVPVTFTYAPK
jgi:hypothetical protein